MITQKRTQLLSFKFQNISLFWFLKITQQKNGKLIKYGPERDTIISDPTKDHSMRLVDWAVAKLAFKLPK